MRPHTFIPSVSALVLAAVLGALALPGPAMASRSASAARGSRIVLSPHRGQVVRSHHAWLRVRAPMWMRDVQGAGLLRGAAALYVSLNGTRLGQRFQRPHRGIRRLRASISQGLRRGRNVLRVSVRRRDGSIRRAKVRFFVRPRGPMVGAGLNRRVAVGATIRLTGRVAPARRSGRRTPVLAGAARKRSHSRMRMRWKVVGHPRRRRMRSVTGAMATKKAALTSATGMTAHFKPAVPGRYTIQLTARRGDDTTSDRVTVTAVPPNPLVEIDTRTSSFGKPGIEIGDAFYPSDWERGAQVVVLNRKTLAVKSNTSRDVREGFAWISDTLKGLDTNDLVIATVSGGVDQDSERAINDALGAIGTPKDLPDNATDFPYSAIGVPGMQRGDGYIKANSHQDGGGLKGYLTPDQYGEYGFVPSQRVPFSYPADIPCSASGCGEGFKIRVQDDATLAPLPHDGEVYNTNGIDLNINRNSDAAERMARDIDDINANHPNALVTIEAVTSRLDDGSGYRAPVGRIYGDAMNRLLAAIASVGGTRNAFNLAATKQGSPASGGHAYILVGWAGAGEGNGAEAAAGVNGTPDAPTLTGVLRPDRQSRLRPQAVSTQGGDPDALANEVMKPPTHDWWGDGNPGQQAAICYLGMHIGQPPLGPNPRLQYWTAATLNTTDLIGDLRALTYPGETSKFSQKNCPTSKFSQRNFDDARNELINELGWVGTVRQYMGELAEPFAANQLVGWKDAHTIADNFWKATNAAEDDDTTYQWLDFTKILLELAGPFTDHATTAIASLMDLGMWIAGATDSGAPTYDEVNIKADDLGSHLVKQAQDTVATYNRIGNIIVSDPDKLKYFGENAGCNPEARDCKKPALEWDQDLKAQASANYYRGIERYLYQQLMPLGYHVFQLMPSDRGELGRVIIRTSPPDVHDYQCNGTFLSAHPWYYYPTGSRAVTFLLTFRDPTTGTSVYTTLVWSQIPGTNTQHGTPPPDDILKRMFEPVPDNNNPTDGGLGMSPQLTMANAPHYFWEGDQGAEYACHWDAPS